MAPARDTPPASLVAETAGARAMPDAELMLPALAVVAAAVTRRLAAWEIPPAEAVTLTAGAT
jgi:hypothetical protein